jgi:hypothetical protein
MLANPFTDIWHFLTATTNDYLHQGNWRYLILALFWALLLAGTAIAFQNWREDSEQRSGRHLGIWLVCTENLDPTIMVMKSAKDGA